MLHQREVRKVELDMPEYNLCQGCIHGVAPSIAELRINLPGHEALGDVDLPVWIEAAVVLAERAVEDRPNVLRVKGGDQGFAHRRFQSVEMLRRVGPPDAICC